MFSKHLAAFLALMLLATSTIFGQSITDIKDDLLRMKEIDQEGRKEIQMIGNQHGYESPEWREAWENQETVDAVNMERLVEIIEEIGWPKESAVGEEAALAAFLILQHSNLEMQMQYLPVVKKAVDEGEASARSYAMLHDRVLLGQGKKQLYGTQLMRDEESGDHYVWPIESESQVDIRRSKLGMPALEDELSLYPIEIGPVPKKIKDALMD